MRKLTGKPSLIWLFMLGSSAVLDSITEAFSQLEARFLPHFPAISRIDGVISSEIRNDVAFHSWNPPFGAIRNKEKTKKLMGDSKAPVEFYLATFLLCTEIRVVPARSQRKCLRF